MKAARTTPLQLAKLLRGAAADKKAWKPVVIDVRDKTTIADYFVVCEGETDRQVKAIADGMVDDRHDSNQELIGQGLANVACPFFGGISATGAIARYWW